MIQRQTLKLAVPLAHHRGDFSTSGYSLVQLHAPAVCQLSPAIQARFATAGEALSGCTNSAPDPTLLVPFDSNRIPFSLSDANARRCSLPVEIQWYLPGSKY